eukprot:766803_1
MWGPQPYATLHSFDAVNITATSRNYWEARLAKTDYFVENNPDWMPGKYSEAQLAEIDHFIENNPDFMSSLGHVTRKCYQNEFWRPGERIPRHLLESLLMKF